jgi:biopolymer transport protein ExbD
LALALSSPSRASRSASRSSSTARSCGTVVEDLAQLERYFVVEAAKANQPELHVQPDRRAKYDTVAQVLAMAQRSGMQRIGFAGQERFLE